MEVSNPVVEHQSPVFAPIEPQLGPGIALSTKKVVRWMTKEVRWMPLRWLASAPAAPIEVEN